MYEIWLALNIVWEIALGIWPLLLAAAVLWLALMGVAWQQDGRHWRAGLWPAVGVGVVLAIVAVLLIPGWTRSTLSNMGYWLDWVVLLGLAAAVAALAVAFAWPLLAWRHGRARP